jgi:hypothetical protein
MGNLTPEEIRQGWFEAIQMYTHHPELKLIQSVDKAPLTIRLAVDKIVEFGSRDGSVAQEKIGDLSLTFKDFDVGSLPNNILVLLGPWLTVRF